MDGVGADEDVSSFRGALSPTDLRISIRSSRASCDGNRHGASHDDEALYRGYRECAYTQLG
jgi:hypothetical protein